ncbi:glycosyltransferase family protein [Fodinibius salsisoli]|uniref:Glycosyl transferase n=1 Tax=Fodinibius salsisoli TaxID=2820877 RepID=A0ABT3PS18_9BACT|nr:glycosyltransferase family protein [Fodinibius salsisoli]MCW9708626.1 hypothetical protein [Fodinibius salsisoli]
MKILYGIQSTGHGHLSRARELLPELSKHASVDVMVSGHNSRLELDNPIKYRKRGISLTYDSNGGVSVLGTLRDLRPIRFISDVHSITISDYDLVVSDYEPVSAWSAKFDNVTSVGLSHQAAFLSPQTPRPLKRSRTAEALLQHFAPTDRAVGFHFKPYDDFIEPPIIRSEIRKLKVKRWNHVTVYLPAYHHEVLQQIFAPFTHINWHIFSPACKKTFEKGNCLIHPVSYGAFLDSFASCSGVICSAGFETCAEAMYLGKKLLVVPIRNQYEQACNAAALEEMGVLTLDSLDNCSLRLWNWLEDYRVVTIDEVADPKNIVDRILLQEIQSKELAYG